MDGHLIVRFAQYSLGSVFLLAAAGKWVNLDSFRTSVSGFDLLPTGLVRVAAFTIAAAETLVSGLFFMGDLVISSCMAVSLLVIFTLAYQRLLLRGIRNAECGCFKPFKKGSEAIWMLTIRNIALCGMTVLTLFPRSFGTKYQILIFILSISVLGLSVLSAPTLTTFRATQAASGQRRPIA